MFFSYSLLIPHLEWPHKEPFGVNQECELALPQLTLSYECENRRVKCRWESLNTVWISLARFAFADSSSTESPTVESIVLDLIIDLLNFSTSQAQSYEVRNLSWENSLPRVGGRHPNCTQHLHHLVFLNLQRHVRLKFRLKPLWRDMIQKELQILDTNELSSRKMFFDEACVPLLQSWELSFACIRSYGALVSKFQFVWWKIRNLVGRTTFKSRWKSFLQGSLQYKSVTWILLEVFGVQWY